MTDKQIMMWHIQHTKSGDTIQPLKNRILPFATICIEVEEFVLNDKERNINTANHFNQCI